MSKPDRKPTQRVKVRLRDQEWVFEMKMPMEQAFRLREATGLDPRPFFQGAMDWNPTCIHALIWLCRIRAGEPTLRLAEVPTDFDLIEDFDIEDESDPTSGDGTPSESDATA